MKRINKYLLFAFSLLVLFFVVCLNINVKATSIYGLVLEDGASIRTIGDQGLRFAASVDDYLDSDEHGFFIARGRHTREEIINAIDSNQSTINDFKMVKKESTGKDLEFALTVLNIDAEKYGYNFTVIAYVLDGETYDFSSNVVTRSISAVGKAMQENSEIVEEDIIDSFTNANVQIKDSNNNYYFYNSITDYQTDGMESGDTINLLSGTYNENVLINKSDISLYGNQKGVAIDFNNPNRGDESIINGCISVLDECDNITIDGLTINGVMLDEGNAAKYWASTSTESSSNSRLAAANTQFGTGIILYDDQENITITNNKFNMISDAKYAIVDSCINNITSGEYKLNNIVHKNLVIEGNYFDLSAGTASTCDIFIRGIVENGDICDNYFKNNYTTTTTTFSYDYYIRLWRIGKSSTATTYNISNNVFNHTKSNIAIDLGYAAHADGDSQTINIENNEYVNAVRRAIRVAYVKASTIININKNDIKTLTGESANYTILLSNKSGATSSSFDGVNPLINIKQNSFEGLCEFNFGFNSASISPIYNIDLNYFENDPTQEGKDSTDLGSKIYSKSVVESIQNPSIDYYKQVMTEVGYAFLNQKAQIQYDQKNSRRNLNSIPEDATAYKGIFLDCSSYTNSVVNYVFGRNIGDLSNPSTATIDTYAKNTSHVESIMYIKNADYTTSAQKAAVLAELKSLMQVGDLLTYRHTEGTSTGGHIMMYIGNDMFLHCTGSSFNYTDNPTQSNDNATSSESSIGAVQELKASTLFTTSGSRYLFDSANTSVSLLRVLSRTDLEITANAANRMSIPGIAMEKTASTPHLSGVNCGDQITYTITLKNNSSSAVSGITVEDVVPENCTYVSCNNSGVHINGNIKWSGITVPANSSKIYTFTVSVNSNVTNGTVITSDKGTVNYVPMNTVYHTVGKLTSSQLSSLQTEITSKLNSSYTDGMIAFKDIYNNALSIDLSTSGITNTTSVLDGIIDLDNKTCYTNTDISKLLIKGFYGGLDIKSGMPSDNIRLRLVKNEYLEEGDIIVVCDESSSITASYMYINGDILGISGGSLVYTHTTDSAVDTFLLQLIAYDKFAIIRPALK